MNKAFFFVFSFLLLSLSAIAGKPIIVIDSNDSSPIEGATVISGRGIIMGITDAKGSINVEPTKDFPLEIRSIGFEPSSIMQYKDTICLSPASYELSEIKIVPGERPINKVTCYIREYSSSTTQNDTIQYYADYMYVGYLAEQKVKGFKKGDEKLFLRNARRYARLSNSEGLDSVTVPSSYDDLSIWMSYKGMLLGIPKSSFEEPEKIKNGASSDTIMGKYSVSELIKKNADLYTTNRDILGDYKDHKWSPWFAKVVGLTFEIDKLQRTYGYKTNPDGKYSFSDFIYGSGTMHGIGKGKLFKHFLHQKSDMNLDGYAELYIIDVEYLTVDEYKEDKKEAKEQKEIPFQEPKNLQPLPPSVLSIIERVNKECKNQQEAND